MALPNIEAAIIDDRKITDYLLSDGHPAGRIKAAFFKRCGFTRITWHLLRDALLQHAATGETITAVETGYGKKYIIDGLLICPDPRRPRIRAVWFVEIGEVSPRLVTAYLVSGDNT
jgi:hypothetical protein